MMLGQRLLITFLLALNLVTAFAPISPATRQLSASSSSSSSILRSFDPKPLAEEGDAKPLESVSTTTTTPEGGDEESSGGEEIKAVYKNLARGGELEEVTWIDPAMSANTNPFEMSWWAYILFGFPVVLLLDDAFHFLPTEGPLAFLKQL